MLSWNVTVIDSNSHSIDPNIRMNDAFDWLVGMETNRMGHYKDWSCVQSAPIHINDGAWIGFGSTIMKGVTIGEGAVVGSNSVVTKDVPPGAIVAGNPARIVGQARNSTSRMTPAMPETDLVATSAPERAKIGLKLQ
jgi:acetyltransferase-like isoleucine patch superfamily enzyme